MKPLDHHYGVILADPPWDFKTYSRKGKGRSAAAHYDVMSLEGIKALPVKTWAARDCVLFLWVTDPMLRKAFEIIDAWGFTYKTVAFTWTKTKPSGAEHIGGGFWTRANPEQCLLATRGQPKRQSAAVRQWIASPVREHSRKPDEIYDRIEALVEGPYLEMFARSRRENWHCWGDQVESGPARRRWRSDGYPEEILQW